MALKNIRLKGIEEYKVKGQALRKCARPLPHSLSTYMIQFNA